MRASNIASKPALASVATLLGDRNIDRVAVTGHIFLTARLPHGPFIRQMLHASPVYHGNAWFDHVEYFLAKAVEGDVAQYGQVRLLLRSRDGADFAVVDEMDRVVEAEKCPMTFRGCTQLR